MPLLIILRGVKIMHINPYIILITILSILINYIYFKDNRKLSKLNTELKLQRTYFDELFENSQDAIVILDNKNRIVNVNEAFENLFLYKNEEIKECDYL